MSTRSFSFLQTADLDSFDARTSALEDPRPHPTQAALVQLGAAIMDETLDLVLGSALEDQASVICESLLGGLHTAVQRLDREADRARDLLARGLRDFDGSEVADHDLQAARHAADAADVAASAIALCRDAAAQSYATNTGETWTPWRTGPRPVRTTAAQIEAREALRAVRDTRLAANRPSGPVVAFRGCPSATGADDAMRIFDALNWAREQWPDMCLATTGAPGAERLAASWARQKAVDLILARPDFQRHARSAPFRANDDLLALEPICVLGLAVGVSAERGRPFGPVLDLVQRAAAAGVLHHRVSARRPSPIG